MASVSMIARDIPMSPTRLTTKAFLAAVAAIGLCCRPMSRYEARPAFPADEHDEVVVGQDQQQHGRHEEVEEGKEPAPPLSCAM